MANIKNVRKSNQLKKGPSPDAKNNKHAKKTVQKNPEDNESQLPISTTTSNVITPFTDSPEYSDWNRSVSPPPSDAPFPGCIELFERGRQVGWTRAEFLFDEPAANWNILSPSLVDHYEYGPTIKEAIWINDDGSIEKRPLTPDPTPQDCSNRTDDDKKDYIYTGFQTNILEDMIHHPSEHPWGFPDTNSGVTTE
jgi:hypothetical protein